MFQYLFFSLIPGYTGTPYFFAYFMPPGVFLRLKMDDESTMETEVPSLFLYIYPYISPPASHRVLVFPLVLSKLIWFTARCQFFGTDIIMFQSSYLSICTSIFLIGRYRIRVRLKTYQSFQHTIVPNKVGHLLSDLCRIWCRDFRCWILCKKFISKMSESWCRMWIESELRQ